MNFSVQKVGNSIEILQNDSGEYKSFNDVCTFIINDADNLKSLSVVIVIDGERYDMPGGVDRIYDRPTYESLISEINKKTDEGRIYDIGLRVTSINNGSPSGMSGVKVGDIIYEYDGNKVQGPEQLDEFIENASKKEKVRIKLMRKEIQKELDIPSGYLGLMLIIDKVVNHKIRTLIFVSSSVIVGEKIVKTLGMARGSTIRTKHIGRDMMAEVKSIVGGELKGYTEMLAEGREEAIYRMKEDAVRLGANAIVDVRFSTSTVMQGAAEILVYGTAVKIARGDQ